jgi:hypothetical protein
MKRIILIVFLLWNSIGFSQNKELTATLLQSIPLKADNFVGFDALGFCYFIKDNIFFKQKKDESWQYKNISLGKITHVDIQNPLNIILFYENFNTIIMLDNQLNETQKINFSENPVPIVVSATGIASQNRLWIYNSLTQQIGLFDYLKSTFQSITPSLQGNLKKYDSDFNTFHWIDENLNWYSCDVFGKISTFGKVSDFEQIQFISTQVVLFSNDGQVAIQDFQKNTIYTIANIEKSFKKFYYKDQILSIFTAEGITNYKISIP